MANYVCIYLTMRNITINECIYRKPIFCTRSSWYWCELTAHPMSQSIYCIKCLMPAQLAEIIMSICHQEATIGHRWTTFWEAQLKKCVISTN